MSRRTRRKLGDRYPNGHLIHERPILETTIARRTELVGSANHKRQEAGYPLGIMLLNGHVTQRQHDAGCRLERAWRLWASLAGIAAHHPHAQMIDQPHSGSQGDVEPEKWQRAKETYLEAMVALAACPQAPLVLSVVETVVIDCVLTPAMSDRSCPATVFQALHRGLDALAAFFRIPMERAA